MLRGRPFALTEEQTEELLNLRAANPAPTVAWLGAQFGVAPSTVWRILKEHKLRTRLQPARFTKEDKAVIRLMTRQRRKGRDIAQFLGRSIGAVRRMQKQLCGGALPRLTPRVAAKIIALGRAGVGIYPTCEITGFSQKKIRSLWRASGIGHKRGGQPFQLPAAQRARFAKAVRSKEFFCKELAKKFGLSKHIALRFAKEDLGVPTFLRGAIWPPLSSNFPQLDAKPSHYVQLVKKICDLCFDGKLLAPEHDAVFVNACLTAIPVFQGQPQSILDCATQNLAEAVHTLRVSRKSYWTN